MEAPRKPLLIYDGDCRFCTLWVRRWEAQCEGRVDFEMSQTAAKRFPAIPAEAFERAVQLIEPGSRHSAAAEAVFRVLAHTGAAGRLLLWWYLHLPLFARVSEWGYRQVAGRRILFSLATRWLWGGDVEVPRFAVAAWIFLRLLGLVYFIAFFSYAIQLRGLVGAEGILPASLFFERAWEALGAGALWQFPGLAWINASDGFLIFLALAGMGGAVMVMAGAWVAPTLVLLWLLYLSLVVAGQVFYQFQWDNLLLEAGFLAIFVAPWNKWNGLRLTEPPWFGRLLLVWLLFRLMFSAGVVKLASGDTAWATLTALEFHFHTQPLPTPLAWFAAQNPPWLLQAGVFTMFVIELVFPFLMFLARRLRLVAFIGLVGLQLVIAATGNYGFFNLLSLILCVWLIDDWQWPARIRRLFGGQPREFPFWWRRRVLPVAAIALLLLSLLPLTFAFRPTGEWARPPATAYSWISPLRTINGYGLFATMTTQRREILVQGTRDGLDWKYYEFKYKPGPFKGAPKFVAPYMPRLDWQMWFAALGPVENSPWFYNFMQRLLEGSEPVRGLLQEDPFPVLPPRAVRAMLDDYTFTTPEERGETGDWWKASPVSIYCPSISLQR